MVKKERDRERDWANERKEIKTARERERERAT